MNILIIGNGFDLAHGLNTRYGDFLTYIKKQSNDEIQKHMDNDRLYYLNFRNSNLWFQHFELVYESNKGKKNNWVDFEKEILSILNVISEGIMFIRDNGRISNSTIQFLKDKVPGAEENKYNKFTIMLNSRIIKKYGKPNDNKICYFTNEDLVEILLEDLKEITSELNKYLIDQMDSFENKQEIKDINFNYLELVINFNYTDTFSRVYGAKYDLNKTKIDYVHGKLDETNNNLVLGINSDREKNSIKEDEFVEFRKFYQRILKKGGIAYADKIAYLNKIGDNVSGLKLSIIGHSLDTTDEDILKPFLLNDNIKTTVYYHSEEGRKNLIINLINMLGENVVVRKVQKSDADITLKKMEMKEAIK